VIIVQTPLRISFFGGGTDFPSFYRLEGGCVLSSAINKYIFITIKERFDRNIRVGYTQTEMVDDVNKIQHELIREALIKTGIRQGVEITTMGDIPSAGSGLGSSSTVTVGSLHAMYSYLGEIVPVERLAREACEIEIDKLGKPIGVQDQYIAALGGFRLLEFCPNGEIIGQRIELDSCLKRQLNESLLLFYTGITRRSESILDEQKKNINGRLSILREMKQMTFAARDQLLAGHLDAFGELLNESWQLKKQLASQISNGNLDDIYQAARHAGAIGGKITGAGGGGFLLFYCPFEKRESVRDALGSLQEVPIQLEPDGTKVIFNYRRS
jgi:D-glycero-alpha-D-manno-heptose-7-phosphate kinase